jgi:phosphoglucosamine mutase
MGKYFGTDGIRNQSSYFTNEFISKVGLGIAKTFKPKHVILAGDTRESSPRMIYDMSQSFLSEGINVLDASVVSTPMLAHYSKIKKITGVMMTASHNPYTDNGIKVFNKGYKLTKEQENSIETYINDENINIKIKHQPIDLCQDIEDEYMKVIRSMNLPKTLLKIGFDSANGANYQISRQVFDLMNPSSIQINNTPDGYNINKECGSTHPEAIINLVKKHNLDIGFSFDGDGDRIFVVDKDLRVYDGDMIIYIIGSYLKEKGLLSKDTVVLTKMSNPGILESFQKKHINYVLTDVGDKYVSEAITTHGYTIGGESSGHIILSHLTHTGDGLLVAAYLVKILTEKQTTLSELINDVNIYPLQTVNIKSSYAKVIVKHDKIIQKISEIKEKLGNPSLLLVRPSGTEPLLRITMSCKDETLLNKYINELKEAIEGVEIK